MQGNRNTTSHSAVAFFLVSVSVLFAFNVGCKKNQLWLGGLYGHAQEQDEFIVETIIEEEPRKAVEIPLPPKPHEDDFDYCCCGCCCEAVCGGSEEISEFKSFINTLEEEATSRAGAAAAALFKSGAGLVQYEGWQEIARSCMDLLSNPTLVVVQLSSGKWKKVKFEKILDLKVEVQEIMMIQRSVGGKMKAAMVADMVFRGIEKPKAEKIAGQIMKTYLEKLFSK